MSRRPPPAVVAARLDLRVHPFETGFFGRPHPLRVGLAGVPAVGFGLAAGVLAGLLFALVVDAAAFKQHALFGQRELEL